MLSTRILHPLHQSPWRSSGAPGSWRGVADKSLNVVSRARLGISRVSACSFRLARLGSLARLGLLVSASRSSRLIGSSRHLARLGSSHRLVLLRLILSWLFSSHIFSSRLFSSRHSAQGCHLVDAS